MQVLMHLPVQVVQRLVVTQDEPDPQARLKAAMDALALLRVRATMQPSCMRSLYVQRQATRQTWQPTAQARRCSLSRRVTASG